MNKIVSKRLFVLSIAVLLVLGVLSGCGKQPVADVTSGTDEPINTYAPSVNADGSVNYLFLLEQFETYKTQLYDAGRFEYAFGTFPSVQSAEYLEVDDAGIPWAIVTYVDKTEYE